MYLPMCKDVLLVKVRTDDEMDAQNYVVFVEHYQVVEKYDYLINKATNTNVFINTISQ